MSRASLARHIWTSTDEGEKPEKDIAPKRGRFAAVLARRMLHLPEPPRPQPLAFTDEITFSAAKWRWHELIVCDHLLAETATRIASYFAHRANWEDGGVYPSIRTISDETGISERSVERMLGRLVDRGWLEVHRRGWGRTNVYRLTTDARLVENIDSLRRVLRDRRELERRRRSS